MTEPTTTSNTTVFNDPQAVANYAQGPRRNLPGFDSLLQMSRVLLSERVTPEGRVLVVGAGCGLELEDMAKAHAVWQFAAAGQRSTREGAV
ncbi:MAG TPA: hypothetical protein VFY22_00915 [Hydrogenophaga sp.]|nr:hypothetical protein [Hydrogenophaga sp.]